MLTELQIENLGVIQRSDLVLGSGVTAFTGETGAGKTMIVEAIELLVGGRADPSSVRSGASEARVEGRFVLDDTEMVVARVIPAGGRSRAYVNGRLATVSSLADVVAGAVDLHGQHAHQRLLTTSTQREALDRYGLVDLEPLREARARLTEVDAALAALGGDERMRAREIDLLRFQVAEIDAAALEDPDEDGRLDDEESTLADANAHRGAGEHALAVASAEGGLRDQLSEVLGVLAGRVPFEAAVSRLHGMLAEFDDVIGQVRDTTESIEEAPERLAALRVRRQLLHELRRKYGDDIRAVMAFHAEAAGRLDELERFGERVAELEQRRARAIEAERAAAHAVGVARRRAAPALAEDVQTRLARLAMPRASMAIEVGDHPGDDPGDRVRYLLAANPGAPLLPLTRVASGGELARSMLALRLALSDAAGSRPGGTLVFDEVDAGIGGEAARAVGAALASLGERHQVLVVTHLAQVASLADHQVRVEKEVRDGVTTATAELLVGDARVDEVARMLSGAATEPARAHARELLR